MLFLLFLGSRQSSFFTAAAKKTKRRQLPAIIRSQYYDATDFLSKLLRISLLRPY